MVAYTNPKPHEVVVRTFHIVSLSICSLCIGCEQFHILVDEDTAVDTAEEVLVPNPSIDITWKPEGLELLIANGAGYEFEFGMVESSTECSIDTEYGCWTAEDCISGYISPQETFSHIPYCHPLEDVGDTLDYSSSLIGVITGSVDDYVIQGEQTAFPAPSDDMSYEFAVTYYLKAISTGSDPTIECWAWGVNPDHFASEGCKSPIPVRLDSTDTISSIRHQKWELPLSKTWTP